ncbi:MAG: hypothetical protein ACK4WB_08900, partial [Desulfatiglandales bacterium]
GIFLTTILIALGVGDSFGLTAEDIKRLKKAGLKENVIQAMIEEKSLETCAFSVEEIIELKRVGLKDNEIEAVIRKGSFLKGQRVVIYGKETVQINAVSLRDILDLKEKNISDDLIRTIILISTDNYDRSQLKETMELLKGMGIILDLRSTDEK